MTDKRFTYEQETLAKVNVFDSDGEFICCTLSVWADQLVDKLNALHEENTKLKKDFNSCSHNWGIMYDEAKEKVEALTKENWELEQENEKLENRLWNCQNVR